MDAATSLRSPATGIRLNWRITPLRLLFALTIAALAVRLIGITLRPLWLDEAYSAWFSSRSWHVLWTEVPTYEPHPPFYYSLLKAWRELAGGSELGLRSLSVVLGVAAVPLVLAASNELEQQQPSGQPLLRAGIAGFLAACSPMLVLLGQEARPYPLLIFAYALATLGLLRLVREFAEPGPGNWRSWLMLATGTELGLWAHGLGLLYALCLAAALAPAWLKRPYSGDRLSRGIGTALLVLLAYVPCLAMIASRAGDWGTGWLSWNPEMILQLVSLYVVPVEVLTIGSAFAALVIVLLAKRAIQQGLTSPGWTADKALLLLWWGPALLAIFISQLLIPVFLPRTLAATLVPAYLALAGALARVESSRERLALAAALLITLTPSAVQVALRPATEPWDEVAAFLNRSVAPGDEVWLYPNDSALPLREAGAKVRMRGVPADYPAIGIEGPIRAGSPAVVSLTGPQALRRAGAAQASNAPAIWLVTRQSGLFDPANELPTALAQARRAGAPRHWGYIAVRPYYRR
jgi:mannosyltransferase